MRPSVALAVLVLVVMCAVVALVGVSGVTEADDQGPSSTETTILEQGPFQGTPVDG